MLGLLTSFGIFKTLYNLALIALFICVFCTQKMKHPSSFYFQEYIYQKHSKTKEGKKKSFIAANSYTQEIAREFNHFPALPSICTDHTLLFSRSNRGWFFWPGQKSHVVRTWSSQICHTNSSLACCFSLDLTANTLFICIRPPHLLVLMLCCQQLACDARVTSYTLRMSLPSLCPSDFHLSASSPNRNKQTSSAASSHFF